MSIKSNPTETPLPSSKWLIFSIVAAGVFMSTLDSSMVNIALPTIMKDFNSPLRDTEWVVLIYLLTITSTLLIWGTLSDRLGRHKIYPLGLFAFALSSLACAFSPKLSCLIGSRLCQALGAGMMMSTGPAIIKETFQENQLGRGLGMISVAVSLGLMTGPVLGGLLLEYYTWRALFFITVPIGFLFGIAGISVIPKLRPETHPAPLNWPGAAAWVLLLVFFALTTSYASAPEWSQVILTVLMLSATISSLLFIILERRSSSPLLPYDLVGQRFFLTALACATLSFLVLFVVLILIPFYLDHVLNMPKAGIGAIMMSIPLSVLLVGPTAGWLSEKIPARKLATIGLCLSTLGALLLSRLSVHSSPASIVIRLMVLGGGQALFLAPNSAAVLKKVARKDTGKSASLLATARNLGMLFGITLAGVVFAHRFSALTGGLDLKDFSPAHAQSFVEALNGAFTSAALLGLVGIYLSWNRDR